MEKIKVTAQQRANAIEAVTVMWPSVPPKNVAKELGSFSDTGPRKDCGTRACFGGWCAAWPSFIAQGISTNALGAPRAPELSVAIFGDLYLFGDDGLFNSRGAHPADTGFKGTDHALVTHRLNWLIKNSVVV